MRYCMRLLLLLLANGAAWLLCAFTTAQQSTTNSQIAAWVSACSGGSLRFEWAIASNWTAANSVSDIVAFRILQNETQVATTDASVLVYNLYGLVNNTAYSFQVRATLANGSSAAPLESDIVIATTGDLSAPARLEQPTVTEVSGGHVRILVQPPLDVGGSSLTTLTATARSTLDYRTVVLTQPTSESAFVLYGLDARTRYVVSAFATNAHGLSGPESSYIEAMTTALEPAGPCPPPTVLRVTGASVTLQLNPPIDDGGARIRGYIVYMASGNSSDFQEVANTVGASTSNVVEVLREPGASDAPLRPLTRYEFKAIAVNNVDVCLVLPTSLSPAAAISAMTSAAGVPATPPSPYLLGATGGQLSVELAKPINMNGSTLTGFLVKVNDVVVDFVATNGSVVHNLNFLTADTLYAVRVAASTVNGATDWSGAAEMRTAAPTAPSLPRRVSVSNITASSAFVQWSLPLDSGGADIIAYGVTLLASDKSVQTSTSMTSLQLSGLVASTAYTVKVTAVNSDGKESSAAGKPGVAFKTTVATRPSMPSGLTLVASTGGSLEVSWNVPIDTGGVDRNDMIYNVTMFTMTTCYKSQLSINSTNDTDSDYCQSCRAVALQGANEYALIANGSSCGRPATGMCPDGTASCCLTRTNSTFGSGLQCSAIAEQGRRRHRLVVGSNATLFQALNHSTMYFVGVKANNLVGSSAFSTIAGFVTMSETPPGFPRRLRSTNRTGGSVELAWDPPLDSGGSTILGYHVYRDYALVTPQLVFPPFVDCGDLTASTQYIYSVAAVSGAMRAEGAMVSTAIVTGPLSAPLPPVVSLSTSASNWLNVSIAPSCDTGGVLLPSYYFIVSQGPNATASVLRSSQFACCSFLVDTLGIDQAYTVAVFASNAFGQSAHVDNEFRTRSGVPSRPSIHVKRANTFSLALAIDDPVPMDFEIVSYDITVYLNGSTLVYSATLPCQVTADAYQRACKRSVVVPSLVPLTNYSVEARVNGVVGSSALAQLTCATTNELAGAFELTTTSLASNATITGGSVVTALVRRVGGTAGAASVRINVTQPADVVLRCNCATAASASDCVCSVHLASTGAASLPGTLVFADGDEIKTVAIAIWDEDYSLQQPLSVVLELVGSPNLLTNRTQALVRIDQSQQSGHIAFAQSVRHVWENASFVKLPLVRLNGSHGVIEINVETFDVASNNTSELYVPVHKTIVFADRQTVGALWVRVINDIYYAGSRTFGVRLTSLETTPDSVQQRANASIVTTRVVVLDDEDPSRTLPDAPTNVRVVHVTGGEIDVAWTASATSASSSLGGYLVRVSRHNATTFVSLYNVTQATSFTLTSLSPASTYVFEVAAWSSFGLGAFAAAVTTTTTASTPPGPPTAVQIETVGHSVVTLSWYAPQVLGGSTITGYVLKFDTPFVAGVKVGYIAAAGANATTNAFTIAQLNASTPYTVYVAAVSAAFPNASASAAAYASVNVTTANGVAPSQPPPVTLLKPATAGSLTLQVAEPSDMGGLPTIDFAVYLRRVVVVASIATLEPSAAPFDVVCTSASTRVGGRPFTCTVYKLLAGASYEVYATFANAAGTSAAGVLAVFTTSATLTIPSAPLNFRATNVTAGNIELAWDVPTDLGGSLDVNGYLVYQRLSVLSNTSFTVYDGQGSLARSTVVKALERNTAYAFSVVALTSASYCVDASAQAVSELLVVSTLASSTLAPPASVLYINHTGGSLTIGWTKPNDLAGVPLLGYHVVDVSSNGSVMEPIADVPADVTRLTRFGLVEKMTYNMLVYAKNQDGLGLASAILIVTTAACTAPSPVQNVRVVSAEGGRIALAWDLPQDTGGRPIVYFEVGRNGRDGGGFVSTSLVFPDFYGLTALTQYMYEIRAFNGLYLGSSSFISASTTDVTLPQPLVLTSVVSFGGKVDVTWSVPEDIGGATSYEFYIALQDASRLVLSSIQTNGTSHAFADLQANTLYYVVGKVLTLFGESALAEYAVTTTSPDRPGEPLSPVVSDVRGGSVVVTVTLPGYSGGESVALALYQGAELLHDFAPLEMSWTVYGLAAMSPYAFAVVASNSAGATRGQLTLVTTGEISTPGAVDEIVELDVTHDMLLLMWASVVDTGGDLALEYQVTYFQCDETGAALNASVVLRTTEPVATLEALEFSSHYSVRVAAVTSTGLFGTESVSQLFRTLDPFPGRVLAQVAEIVVREDASIVRVQVMRIDGSFGNASFSFATQDGTAVAGVNYAQASGTMTLATNVKTAFVSIEILDDAVYAPNTTFTVIITDNITQLSTQTRIVLTDNGDAGFLSFASATFSFLENAGEVVLPITRVGSTAPSATIRAFIANKTSTTVASPTRFELVESVLLFAEGVTSVDVRVKINDDSAYQFVRDAVNISFEIVSGGPMYGAFSSTNVTAVDDGDISPPKPCTSLVLVSVTGGSMHLRWTPPLDRGGENIALVYDVDFRLNGNLVLSVRHTNDSGISYGLNASTTYDVSARAINSAGSSLPSTSSLLTTAVASRASAPLNVTLLAASSSMLLIAWDVPIDDGGSRIATYKIYNVIELSTGALVPFARVTCNVPTICSVKGLVALTNYTVQVRATTFLVANGTLSDPVVLQTATPDVPEPPPAMNVTLVTAGAIGVQMLEPPNIGGAPIQLYRLFLMEDGASEFTIVHENVASRHSAYRLKRETSYQLKYQVVNAVGSSGFSPVSVVKTLERSLPSAPLRVTVLNTTGGATLLAWDEPLDVGGRAIAGYRVMINNTLANGSDTVGYDGKRDPTRQGTVYGLKASTNYTMYVFAYSDISSCFEPSNWSPSRAVALQTLPPTLPGTAPLLLLSRYTGGIIEVTWTEPKDTGGVPITGYVLYAVSAAGSLLPLYAPATPNVSMYIDRNLTESTTYSYIVIARNNVGESPPSALLTRTTTAASPPSAPLNVKQLTYKTGGAIEIGWDRPIDSGGQPLDGYLIYRDGVALAMTLNATSMRVIDKSNLVAGKSYEYTLRSFSTSALGSEFSAICTATTSSATKPQMPQLVSVSAGPSTIDVVWAADLDAGGLPIKSFDVTLSLGATVVTKFTVASTTTTFRGLNASSTYTLSIIASNNVGPSPALLTSRTTLAVTLPAAPPAPTAVQIFGGNFTLQLTAPIEHGGAVITAMTVFERTLGKLATVAVPVGATFATYSFIGALRETDYFVSCSAANSLDTGPVSVVATVRTSPQSAPGAIALPPVFDSATGTTLTATWLAPLDTGGDPLDVTYELRVQEALQQPLVFPSMTRHGTATGLKYATLYAMSARAVNRVGAGPFSPSISLRTQPDTAGEFNFVNTSVPIQVMENDTQVSLLVVRTNGLSGRVVLAYKAVGISQAPATVGSDFQLVPGLSVATASIVFESLQTSATIVVTIVNDKLFESADEMFAIELVEATGTAAGATLGANKIARVLILDDADAGYIGFERGEYEVSESTQVVTLPIVREKGSSGKVVLSFAFNGTATLDRDYRRVPTNLTLDDSVTRAELKVPIINDRIFEFPDEMFVVTITVVSGGAVLRRSSTQVTILDDGDTSMPGVPPLPVVLSTTGGAASLSVGLPIHNGSAKGQLTGYSIRLSSSRGTTDLNVPVTSIVPLGNLTALTTYHVAVAAVNAIGQSDFSAAVEFTTADVSLPGPISRVELREQRGGRLKLFWFAPYDTGGVPITKYRVYDVDALGLPRVVVTNLDSVREAVVYNLTATTQYSFVIQAGNTALEPVFAGGWGAVSPLFTFSTSKPTLPGSTQVYPDLRTEPTGGSIPLRWDTPIDTGGVPITGYNVYARNSTSPFLLVRQRETDTSLSGSIATLYARTWYESFVLPRNGEPPVDVPGNVSIISGARVAQTTSDLSKWFTTGSVINIVNTSIHAVVGNMSRATKSAIPLLTSHAGGSLISRKMQLVGYAFQFVNLSTVEAEVPRTPPAPVLERATGGFFDITLSSPDDTGGLPIQDFNVYMNGKLLDSDALDKESVREGLKLTTRISVGDFTPLTTYAFQIVAVNALSVCYFGDLAMSDVVRFTTMNVTPPGQPQIRPKRETGAGVALNLIDPRDKGGRTITHYRVYYKRNGTTEGKDDWKLGYSNVSYNAVIARLESSKPYVFKLSVSNGRYESVNSTELVRSTTPPSPPGASAEPSLVRASGGMLNVTWDPPIDDGNEPITGYFVSLALDADGSGKTSRLTADRYYAFYALRRLTDYRIVVRADNNKGRGPESSPATFRTLDGTAPAGPMDVTVQMTTGGAAVITFNEPIDLGGASPQDVTYQVFVDREHRLTLTASDLQASQATTASSSSRRLSAVTPPHRRLAATAFNGVIVGGFDPEGLYSVQILPVSAFGVGTTTAPTPVLTTAPTAPSMPLTLTAAVVTGGSVTMTWNAPQDTGGVPLIEYVLSIATASSSGPFTTACTDTQTTCTVRSLAHETTYWFNVMTRNDVGDSPVSTTVSVTTPDVTPPSSPTNVRIVAVGHDAVDCAWDVPDDLGGSTIASYTVNVASLDGTFSTPVTATRKLATVLALPPSTACSITVVATSRDGGDSNPSSPLYFTTSASATSLPAPQIGCVSQATVSLRWYPFRGATTYYVQRDDMLIYTGTQTDAVDDQALVAGTSYAYDVYATIDGVNGTLSPQVAVTTLDTSVAAGTSYCFSDAGTVSELDYKPNSSKTWRLVPQHAFDVLTLRFDKFDLECDHDKVTIREVDTDALVWQGGCLRDGSTFLLQSTAAVAVHFESDNSVSKSGFRLHYDTNTQPRAARIPPPGGSTNVCSQHGQLQLGGTCKCSIGFTGEACSSRIVCCHDPTRCHHPVCDLNPARVIVVAGRLGDDTLGTGQLMDASETGTATKAVATLSKALSLSADGDTIFVYPDVYAGRANRDVVVRSKPNVSICTLRGSRWTTIDCAQLGRAFDIAQSTLTLEGLTLANCVATDGAALRVTSSTLTLNDVVVTTSVAVQRGGALYSAASTVTMSDSVIRNCSATIGGGAFLVDSLLIMRRSMITQCDAVTGGALALEETTTVTGITSSLTANTASSNGGAIAVQGNATVVGLDVVANSAEAAGGAIAVSSGRLAVKSAQIADNRAGTRGGALALVGTVDTAITGSSIVRNSASVSGGGIFIQGHGELALARVPVSEATTTVLSNNAAPTGGGIHIADSTMRITGGRIRNGSASDDGSDSDGSGGGGIAVTDSVVELSLVSFQSNSALSSRGGGLFINASTVECTGSVDISSNRAKTGGGIWLTNSTLVGHNVVVVQANAVSHTGGGLYLDATSHMSDVAVRSCTASRGGGAHVDNANVTLTSVSIESCRATLSGGALYMTNSTIAVAAVVLTNGTAISGGGAHVVTSTIAGELYVDNCVASDAGGGVAIEGTSSLSDLQVTACRARVGGGIAVSSAALVIERVTVSNSVATAKGGGLYAVDSTITAHDSVFTLHMSGDAGGALMLESSRLYHNNVTVANSMAKNGGGAYLISSSLVAELNATDVSLIVANNATRSGGNVYATAVCTLTSLDISGGSARFGGGVALSAATGAVERCLVSLNTASSLGGGVHISTGSAVEFDSVEVFENTAETEGGGGGVAILDSTLLHLELNITSNFAPKGGGVYVSGVVEIHTAATTATAVDEPQLKCHVKDNMVEDEDGIGAGMYVDAHSRLNASFVVFSGGEAKSGGGIYVTEAELWLSDSAINDNTVELRGGGIYLGESCDLSLINCELNLNTAFELGGGIASSGAESGQKNRITITNSLVNANRAIDSGGGIMLSHTNLDGTHNTFSLNLVRNLEGGALSVLTVGDVELIDSHFINNTVGSGRAVKGSSLAFTNGAHAVVTNCSIVSNQVAVLAAAGGLIYVKDTTTRVAITDSLLSDGQSFSGGLIYSEDASVSIVNCRLLLGWADNFGGAIFAHNTRLEVRDSRLAGSFAYYDGGAIYMRTGGSLILRNNEVHDNTCQDRGGALFVAPGAAIACAVTDTTFTFNRNFGLGSTIFIGRKSALVLTRCVLQSNGDSNNEGGAIFAIDAAVTIADSIIESNYARKGAAVELSRGSALTMTNATVRNNTADVWGGALYTSVQAVALVSDSVFEYNWAAEGGALYSIGSSRITFMNVVLRGNTALTFGGGASMRAGSQLTADGVTFSANLASTGGALAMAENASLALTMSVFADNAAQDLGGALYIDTATAVGDKALACANATFANNNATAGLDIYWVYNQRFSRFECVDSISTTSATAKPVASTSAMAISAGWWPTTVTSGVSLGVPKTTNASLLATPDDVATQVIATDPTLSRQRDTVLWPTVVLRDFYGAIAHHDNVSTCVAHYVDTSNTNASFFFSPSNRIAAANGYAVFDTATVFSESRVEPYIIGVTCQLPSAITRFLAVEIIVERCKTGFQNVDGLCIPCKKGYYSLDGVKCYLCPPGATCEQPDSTGVTTGVSAPIRAAGYYLWGGRDSYLATDCTDPSTWATNDPCRDVHEPSMADRIKQCSKLEHFDSYWSRKRIFACLSGNEYYPCDTHTACVQEQMTGGFGSTMALSTQCLEGYTGVMCATCIRDYYKVSNGMCKPCSDPTDPAVARIAHLLAMVPIWIAVTAIVLVVAYFWNASEREILQHASAAKKFQVYDVGARPATLLLAAKFVVQQRAQQLIARMSARMRKRPDRQTQRYLFDIEPSAIPPPMFRAEKVKILLGFFQIFGGFKKVYDIPWPNELSSLVDVFSIVDFSLVDTTGVECFFEKNYFKNYRLSVIVVFVLLAFTGAILAWGVVRYRVLLSTLPRHCVHCGLPVFKLVKREATTVTRRSALLLKLQAEHTNRPIRRRAYLSLSARIKAKVWTHIERIAGCVGKWWTRTRVGRSVERFVRFTRLPASSSEHQPTCPTSHVIQRGDVLGMVIRSNLRLWRARIRLRLNYQSYQNKCAKLFFWILLLFYPELSQRVIGLFYCDEIGDKWYMSRDRSLLCYEGVWLYYVPMTAVLIVLWVIGVPLLFWVLIFVKRRSGVSEKLLLLDVPSNGRLKQRLLREMREDLASRGVRYSDDKIATFETDLLTEYLYNSKLREPSTIAQVGFIYNSYALRFWWFEVWDLGRKLFLTSIISLLAKSGANRIIAGLLVLLIYLSVMLFYQPYKEHSDSALAGVTQIQLFVTLFCGLILKMGSLYLDDGVVTMLTYVTLLSNVATLLFAVGSLVYEQIDNRRKQHRQVREAHHRAIQRHVRTLWRRAYGFAFTEAYLRDAMLRPMPVHVILELARRDRHERELDAIRTQLELATAAIGHPHDVSRSTSESHRDDEENDEDIVQSASQVDVELIE